MDAFLWILTITQQIWDQGYKRKQARLSRATLDQLLAFPLKLYYLPKPKDYILLQGGGGGSEGP